MSSQQDYRANLNSKHFPFLTQLHNQTVIMGQQDQAFDNGVAASLTNQDDDRDKGFPQLYYCHNVMPTSEGVMSVGFNQRVAGVPGSTDFDNMFILRDPSENKFLYSPANNKNYIWDADLATWMPNPGHNIASDALVTTAYLNGHTYVFFQGIGAFEYDTATHLLQPVVLVGVTAANLHGLTASNGYLIAWDDFNVYRSQPISPLDFTPDISQGSGASIPDDIKGKIVICLPISNGFIIYTAKNAVGASFSQNIRYPFIYREVTGSAGILNSTHVAWQNNDGNHYAWTLAGLQKINKTTATEIFPQASDFISGRVFEDFNELTNLLETTKLTSNLNLKLAIVGKRYVIISYGVTELTHALVHDLLLKRWGKIKIMHVCAFEYSIPNLYGDITWAELGTLTWADLGDTSWADLASTIKTFEAARETLAFMQKDGTIYTVEFDLAHQGDSGVAILGKYQLARARFLSLDGVVIENSGDGILDSFSLIVYPTVNGRTWLTGVTPYLAENGGQYKSYLCNVEGLNHSLVFKGRFDLACLILSYHATSRS